MLTPSVSQQSAIHKHGYLLIVVLRKELICLCNNLVLKHVTQSSSKHQYFSRVLQMNEHLEFVELLYLLNTCISSAQCASLLVTSFTTVSDATFSYVA